MLTDKTGKTRYQTTQEEVLEIRAKSNLRNTDDESFQTTIYPRDKSRLAVNDQIQPKTKYTITHLNKLIRKKQENL